MEQRELIVRAVVDYEWLIQDVAQVHAVTRQTVSRFVQAHQTGGTAGLVESSRRPKSSPQRKSLETEAEVLRLRQGGWGPARIGHAVDASGSTVHRILCDHGLNNPALPQPKYPRYEKDFPGELVHIDTKQLVPLATGQPPQYLFAALDAFSREAYIRLAARSNGAASKDFLDHLLTALPYPVQAVMTDNGLIFTMRRTAHPERQCPFEKTLREQEIRHLVTRPYTPRTNGKVERFFGTLERELLRVQRFSSDQHREEALHSFAAYYNQQRYHSAIKNAPTPYRLHFYSNHR